MTKSVPSDIINDVALFRYRERMHLSYAEAMNEPAFAINQALLVWEMEEKRDKLEEESERAKHART